MNRLIKLFGKTECEDCKKLHAYIKELRAYAKKIQGQSNIHLARTKAVEEIAARMQRREEDLRYREECVGQTEILLEKYKDDLYNASQNVAQLRNEKQTLISQIKKALAALEEGNYDRAHEILLAKAKKKRRRSKRANVN